MFGPAMQVVLVLAHPCDDSFNHSVAAHAADALRGAGHHVDVLDLYALGVGAAMSADERRAYHSPDPIVDPLLAEHAALLRRAEALVFVYPTWWSSMPAILKGWLERVMVPGLAFVFDAEHRVRPGLGNVRRIVGISTYGSPRLYVRAVNDNGRRTLTRALRLNTGMRTRARWLALYALDTASADEREQFLRKVGKRMRSL
jgi:NAD(P)H dehydrogenase (quinone)